MTFIVDFEPLGIRVPAEAGETILQAAQRGGIRLSAVCGGGGTCGRCLIRILAGEVTAPSSEETNDDARTQLSAGWQLACKTQIKSAVRVYVPPNSLEMDQRMQTEGERAGIALDPAVQWFDLELRPPTLDDPLSDTQRIRNACGRPDLTFSVSVLASMPSVLRQSNFRVRIAVRDTAVLAVFPAHTPLLGLALDLGTTKLAGYLINLSTGAVLASLGKMNPQIAYGEDVMARITYAAKAARTSPPGDNQLRIEILKAVNELAAGLCAQAGTTPDEIVEAVIVGNTAMHHLFLGLPVGQLGQAPYVAVENAALDLASQEVGLNLAPGARVISPPMIGGFIGSDHIAMLLAADLNSRGDVVLAMDIGTNTELSLLAHGRHLVCSTASGPAFEGAHIHYGMRAGPGAIEHISLSGDQPAIKTIENLPPIGICGSGILSLIAELRRSGLLNRRGLFQEGLQNNRIRTGPQGTEYVLLFAEENNGREITLSNIDVNEIQLAKGAIQSAITVLLEIAGIQADQIDSVVIAGAFGSYLDISSSIEIGMFPRLPIERFVQIGNAAGMGACQILMSRAQREQAAQLPQQTEYIELTSQKGFSKIFAQSLKMG